MKKTNIFLLLIVIGLLLMGCSNISENNNSTQNNKGEVFPSLNGASTEDFGTFPESSDSSLVWENGVYNAKFAINGEIYGYGEIQIEENVLYIPDGDVMGSMEYKILNDEYITMATNEKGCTIYRYLCYEGTWYFDAKGVTVTSLDREYEVLYNDGTQSTIDFDVFGSAKETLRYDADGIKEEDRTFIYYIETDTTNGIRIHFAGTGEYGNIIEEKYVLIYTGKTSMDLQIIE